MSAHHRARLVRLMLSATTAAIILATAMGPISSPGIAAKGTARHGHAQHQTTERGTGTRSQHPPVASAGTKRHSKHKKTGSHRSGHGHSGTIFNPPSPTAPTVRFTTETREFTDHCIAYPDPPPILPGLPAPAWVVCSNFSYAFNEPTPVQVEVIPTLPCGRGTVWITPLDDDQILASRQDIPSGVSSGVIDLGPVKGALIRWQLSNYEGCGPIPRTGFPYTMSVTLMVTTPTPIPVLNP